MIECENDTCPECGNDEASVSVDYKIVYYERTYYHLKRTVGSQKCDRCVLMAYQALAQDLSEHIQKEMDKMILDTIRSMGDLDRYTANLYK